ncbi:hypothetical protein [Sinisalibacter aestuarii]|uniref:Transcription factor zinc-finger domain-containing protein n=1 Tax=Sinisalibacter aestuarii TaxID=2949426 RepID=A0ABQ5LWU1_9RHOB|nr:hypothetical protein [Sinisalibacter aestuarii]GKY88567.1 hypothetical protein STA1M1_24360 [Sinisalibacter aestuarii]
MKITCSCGATIHDGTDALPHKGHAIADRDWGPFWEALDAALARPRAPAAMAMELRRKASARRMWECRTCGRLWIDRADGGLLSYAPEPARVNKVFEQ